MRFIKICFISILLTSCVKEPQPPEKGKQGPLGGKIVVLNEGLFQQNNASITLIDPETGEVTQNWFQLTYGQPLGDTGNDLVLYGNKMYIIINVSGTIEVIDITSGDYLGQILLQENQQSKQPRYGIGVQGNLWVSCFDGTIAVIDTTSLSVSNTIPVGRNPEGLVQNGNKVWVANSGGLDYPNYDTTVSVIDIATQTEVEKITVGPNSAQVASDDYGNTYVISRGNYGSIPSQLYVINEFQNVSIWPKDSIVDAKVQDDLLYVTNNKGGNRTTEIFQTFSQQKVGEVDFPWEQLTTPGGFDFYGQKWVMYDANQYTQAGWIHVLNAQGTIENSYKTGLIPTDFFKID